VSDSLAVRALLGSDAGAARSACIAAFCLTSGFDKGLTIFTFAAVFD